MIYIVTFDTQHKAMRETKHYVRYCEAKNAKEAVSFAKEEWATFFPAPGKALHQFHIHAVKSRCQDPDLIGLRTWRDAPIRGKQCFDCYCIGITRWLY